MMLLEEEDGLVSAKDTTEPFLLAGFPVSPLPDVRLPNLNEETKLRFLLCTTSSLKDAVLETLFVLGEDVPLCDPAYNNVYELQFYVK